MLVVYGTVIATLAIGFVNETLSMVALIVAAAIAIGGSMAIIKGKKKGTPAWHAILEGRALIFTVLVVVGVLVGGVAELVPLVVTTNEDARATNNVPYTPLELHGRDVYLSEGCYVCHSQMIRPFAWETARYGAVSTIDDSIFDHPFQWGSKRTGPDLAREGGLRSNVWHYQHMTDPRQITPGSLMPPYAHLSESRIDLDETAAKMRAMRAVGVPYRPEEIATGAEDALSAGRVIASDLETAAGLEAAPDSHMVALISYLQRLGKTPEGDGDGDDEAVAVNH
jgi:cytochrome c oxidase cbb3-type subunit I/II